MFEMFWINSVGNYFTIFPLSLQTCNSSLNLSQLLFTLYSLWLQYYYNYEYLIPKWIIILLKVFHIVDKSRLLSILYFSKYEKCNLFFKILGYSYSHLGHELLKYILKSITLSSFFRIFLRIWIIIKQYIIDLNIFKSWLSWNSVLFIESISYAKRGTDIRDSNKIIKIKNFKIFFMLDSIKYQAIICCQADELFMISFCLQNWDSLFLYQLKWLNGSPFLSRKTLLGNQLNILFVPKDGHNILIKDYMPWKRQKSLIFSISCRLKALKIYSLLNWLFSNHYIRGV